MAIAKKRKKFFEVEIPLIEKTTHVRAFDLKNLNERHIKYDLTRNLRGKATLMQFKISVEEDKAIAKPRKLQLLPFFLKRAVRKGTSYIEDSFSTNTKDAQIRIKPFLVARRKVTRKVRKALRKKAQEELIKKLAENTTEEIFQEILKNKLQKELSLILKKIYPLSTCEIRVLKIEKDLKKESEKKEKTTTKKKE